MAKKAKPIHRWRVSLIKGTPARYLGYVEAETEEEARKQAAKEYKVPDTLRNRLVAGARAMVKWRVKLFAGGWNFFRCY